MVLTNIPQKPSDYMLPDSVSKTRTTYPMIRQRIPGYGLCSSMVQTITWPPRGHPMATRVHRTLTMNHLLRQCWACLIRGPSLSRNGLCRPPFPTLIHHCSLTYTMLSIRDLCFILFCLPLIHAQYGNGPSSSTETTMDTSASPTPTSSSGAVHTVDVGEDGFTYNPDTVTAAAGDKVEFHFYPGDHSVVQAAFSSPCQPLNDSSVFSGFMLGTSDGSVSLQAIYGELAANILCYHTARHLHRDY